MAWNYPPAPPLRLPVFTFCARPLCEQQNKAKDRYDSGSKYAPVQGEQSSGRLRASAAVPVKSPICMPWCKQHNKLEDRGLWDQADILLHHRLGHRLSCARKTSENGFNARNNCYLRTWSKEAIHFKMEAARNVALFMLYKARDKRNRAKP
eukprot:1159696-Pelagomonas_calceolata.AAC.19